MKVIHQVLVYADDVNLLDYDIRMVERNADMLLKACKVIGLSSNKENQVNISRTS
jgi:hypothetical protein